MKRSSRFSASFLTLALLAASIGCATFFLSGCQFFGGPEKTATIDEQPNERRIGTIRSLGGLKTSNQGTHLLQLDDGDTILLKSLSINLDDAQYSGKTVEVRGVITYTTDNKQLMEVLNIDVVQDTPTQQLKELSWQNYDNASMGFSVKYRSDMKVSDTDNSVTFEKQEEASEASSLMGTEETSPSQETEKTHLLKVTTVAAGTKNYDAWLKTEFPTLKSDSSSDLLTAGLTKSKVGASSLDAVKHTEGPVVDYYIDGGKSFYMIHIDSGSDSSSLEDQNLFYEMLSSFTVSGAPSSSQELEEVDLGGSSGDDTPSTPKSVTTSNTTSTEDEEEKAPTKPATTTTSGSTTSSSSSTTTSSGGTSTQPTSTAPATATPPPSTSGSSTTSTEASASTVSSDVAISGFTKLESETFNFSMQFPKSWYYSGTVPTESGVVRHYDFGSKPLDEVEGTVSLDVMNGSVPTGSAVTVNGKNLVKVTSGDAVEYYYQGDGSRVYRVTGPASSASTLATMASSVEE